MFWNINELNSITTPSDADQLPIWSSTNGFTAKISLSSLKTYILTAIGGASGVVTQYAAPAATGSTINVDNNFSTWLLIIPIANYAAMTIVLPASPVNGQRVNYNITKSVTTLTWNGNGSAVVGAPATLATNDFGTLTYDGVTKTWYRTT